MTTSTTVHNSGDITCFRRVFSKNGVQEEEGVILRLDAPVVATMEKISANETLLKVQTSKYKCGVWIYRARSDMDYGMQRVVLIEKEDQGVVGE